MRPPVRYVLSALLAVGLTPAAHAGNEVYLRWDNCLGDGGTYNRVFACDTNSGFEVLVGSFRLDETMDQASGLSTYIHLAPTGSSTPMPAWWSLRPSLPAGCRWGSLTVSFAPPVTSTVCVDRWNGRGRRLLRGRGLRGENPGVRGRPGRIRVRDSGGPGDLRVPAAHQSRAHGGLGELRRLQRADLHRLG